jgi:membrane protein required for colicin V production
VDIISFIRGLNLFDLVVILVFAIAFVLGFIQGTIRRLLGLGSILFSYLLAANVRDPLGAFFAANWHQFPTEYSYFIAFGAVFLLASVGFSLLIQGFYRHQELFVRARFADEVIGGLLGILQAAVIIGAMIVILDSYFRLPFLPRTSGELILVRDVFNAMDRSNTAQVYRDVLIPSFNTLVGFLLPADVRAVR